MHFNAFAALSEDDVCQVIHDSSKKSCSLDPMPISVALDYLDIHVLLPVITKIVKMDSTQSSSNKCKNYLLKIYSQHIDFLNTIKKHHTIVHLSW